MEFSAFISSVFALPASAVSAQKLPKTFFYNSFDLLPAERKLIENPEAIESIEIFGLVNPRSANIPAIHTEDETFDEVIFISVKSSILQFDKQKNKIAEILHKYIPNHLVIAVYAEEKMMLSIAEKRINQNEANKRIVTAQYDTESMLWHSPSDAQTSFLQQLNFSRANTFNIQEYYRFFVQCFSGLEISKSVGKFALRTFERSREDVQALNTIKQLEEEIITFQNKAKKESQVNDILHWNIKIQENRKKIQQLNYKITNP